MRSKRVNKVGLRLSKCYGRLTDRHVDDLCSQSTLKASAGLSLSARAQAFNESHPSVHISASKLFQIYRRNGVKYKKIKMTKLLNTSKQKKTDEFLL